MKPIILNTTKGLITLFMFVFCVSLSAQTQWPLTMVYEDLKIQIFKPEVESFNTNKMAFRSALMITEGDNNVFGSLWANANLKINNANRTVTITSAAVEELRFPDGYAADKESDLIKVIQRNLVNVTFKMDKILSDLDNNQKEQSIASTIDNTPPVIYYSSDPAILLTIDGDPIIQPTDNKDIEMVVNSAFLILKYRNIFYLSNGALWYESKSPLAGWAPKKSVPNVVSKMATSLKSDDEDVVEENSFYPKIFVSTVAAELIQTDGAPTFAAIPSTAMLYITNTSDQIVMDIKSQQYFVLLSGRWYASTKLDGTWSYIDFDNLPADFANIPEGSDKDILLASVPNTKASQDAVRESLIPQAAIVNRNDTKTEVVYDGDPSFENIEGTDMRYAVNSSGTVIHENNTYYVVDNGVWFVGSSPRGPWVVSDVRPVQVNIIPPSSPVYNARYVYVYHSTPQVVYVGYTRGYLSSYVVGPTVVYGTGYRYKPWRGRWYYPRPCTWGFGVSYNPWYGWSVNHIYGSGWFGYSYPHDYYSHYPYYSYRSNYRYRSGWWGPSVYRPPYHVPHTHYYGRHPSQVRSSGRYTMRSNDVRTSSSRNNNIYAYNSGRGGVQSARSSTRTTLNTDSRQSLTRSYSSQARPTSSRNPDNSSVNSSTRPSSNSGRNPSSGTSTRPGSSSGTSTRPSSGTSTRPSGTGTTTRPSGTGTTTRPGSSGTNTTRPSGSSGTRNPATTTQPSRSGSTTQPSRSGAGSSSIVQSSRSGTGSSTTQPSRSGTSGSTTTRPSGSSGTRNPATTTQPSRSGTSNSSTTTQPSRSGTSGSTTTRPSGSSGTRNPATTTQPSRSGTSSSSTTQSSRSSSSSSATTQPSRSGSSSSTTQPSRSGTSSSSSTTQPSRSSSSSSSTTQPSRSGSSSSTTTQPSRSGTSSSSSTTQPSRSSSSSSSTTQPSRSGTSSSSTATQPSRSGTSSSSTTTQSSRSGSSSSSSRNDQTNSSRTR